MTRIPAQGVGQRSHSVNVARLLFTTWWLNSSGQLTIGVVS